MPGRRPLADGPTTTSSSSARVPMRVGEPGVVRGPVHGHHRPAGGGQGPDGGRPDAAGRPGHHGHPVHRPLPVHVVHPVHLRTSVVDPVQPAGHRGQLVGGRRPAAGAPRRQWRRPGRRGPRWGSPPAPPAAGAGAAASPMDRRSPGSARSRCTRSGAMASIREVSVRPACRSPGQRGHHAVPDAPRGQPGQGPGHGPALPPWVQTSTTWRSRGWPSGPARPGAPRWPRPMERVPAKPSCSPLRAVGHGRGAPAAAGGVGPPAAATATAMSVSVVSGRWGPCCSVAPTGTTRTAPPAASRRAGLRPGRRRRSRVTARTPAAPGCRIRWPVEVAVADQEVQQHVGRLGGVRPGGPRWADRGPPALRSGPAAAAADQSPSGGGTHPGAGREGAGRPRVDRTPAASGVDRPRRDGGGRPGSAIPVDGQGAGQRGPAQPGTRPPPPSTRRAAAPQALAPAAVEPPLGHQHPLAGRSRLEGHQPESLGGTQLVGQEGGEGPGAPVDRAVAAQHQVGWPERLEGGQPARGPARARRRPARAT